MEKHGTESERRTAWHPLTPGGVAAFSGASYSHLGLLLLVWALVCGGLIATAWRLAWAPVLQTAIERLPEHSVIRDGRLEWVLPGAKNLAANRFLSIEVDPENELANDLASDVLLEFQARWIRAHAAFGYADLPYPRYFEFDLSRSALAPGWGAWGPALFAGLTAGLAACLIGLWLGLGLVYAPIARSIGFLADRKLSWAASHRLATAALCPGALLVSGSILLYALQQLDWVALALMTAFHFVVGWLYLIAAPFRAPRFKPRTPGLAPRENPFSSR